MASYVVMEQPGRRGTADIAFLRDGFSWVAFLVAPLWLLWHRLWVEALLAFVALGLLSALVEAGWPFASSLPALLVSLFVGLEGRNLRVGALRRHGWREWGVIDAKNLSDAEMRYAATVVDEDLAEPDAPRIVPGPAPARPAHPGLVLGLGPAPGRA